MPGKEHSKHVEKRICYRIPTSHRRKNSRKPKLLQEQKKFLSVSLKRKKQFHKYKCTNL
jgi:hypothetical protein